MEQLDALAQCNLLVNGCRCAVVNMHVLLHMCWI